MNGLIVENVITNGNDTFNHINTYFKQMDLYNDNLYDIFSKMPKHNILIYIFIVFLVFHFISRLEIRLNEILAWMVCIVLIYFLLKKDYTEFIKYTQVKQNELDFLHKLMFDDGDVDYGKEDNLIIKPIGMDQKSYLYLNPCIVSFFYDLRQYIQYNLSSYVGSLIHCNNVIGIEYESEHGINRKYYNYEMAVEESDKALNDLNSLIYGLPTDKQSFDTFVSSIDLLHRLLNSHLKNISVIFKNDNKGMELNIDRKPDDFYEIDAFIRPNNTGEKGYISTYHVF